MRSPLQSRPPPRVIGPFIPLRPRSLRFQSSFPNLHTARIPRLSISPAITRCLLPANTPSAISLSQCWSCAVAGPCALCPTQHRPFTAAGATHPVLLHRPRAGGPAPDFPFQATHLTISGGKRMPRAPILPISTIPISRLPISIARPTGLPGEDASITVKLLRADWLLPAPARRPTPDARPRHRPDPALGLRDRLRCGPRLPLLPPPSRPLRSRIFLLADLPLSSSDLCCHMPNVSKSRCLPSSVESVMLSPRSSSPSRYAGSLLTRRHRLCGLYARILRAWLRDLILLCRSPVPHFTARDTDILLTTWVHARTARNGHC